MEKSSKKYKESKFLYSKMLQKPTLAHELEEIVKIRKEPETQIIVEAIEIGLAKLWKETILDQFIQGKIPKEKAIKLVGQKLVELTQKQKEAIIEDIEWGLSYA